MNDSPSPPSRLSLYALIGLILLILIVYSWKTVEIRRLRAQMESRILESTEASRQALSAQKMEMLRLSGVSLGWAVREDVMKENYAAVDDYFRRFVKEPGVDRMFLVGSDRTIKVASDKKLEGEPASTYLSETLLNSSQIRVEKNEDGLVLAVPIMGLDSKLGVLALVYSGEEP